MTEPLFPIRPPSGLAEDQVLLIEPYRFEGTWVFDDTRIGLVREPFVAGVTEMIDRLVTDIPDAEHGFRLSFGASPFQGYQTYLTWLRADSVEGNWYRTPEGEEGWLCPALFWYFSSSPERIYVRADPRSSE